MAGGDGEEDAVLRAVAEKNIDLIMGLEGNTCCADCGSHLTKATGWGSLNLGVVVCIKCAGVHRSMGVHISRIASFQLDHSAWTDQLYKLFLAVGGNVNANLRIWEACLPSYWIQPKRDLSEAVRESFIREKYDRKAFLPADTVTINPCLRHMPLEVMQCSMDMMKGSKSKWHLQQWGVLHSRWFSRYTGPKKETAKLRIDLSACRIEVDPRPKGSTEDYSFSIFEDKTITVRGGAIMSMMSSVDSQAVSSESRARMIAEMKSEEEAVITCRLPDYDLWTKWVTSLRMTVSYYRLYDTLYQLDALQTAPEVSYEDLTGDEKRILGTAKLGWNKKWWVACHGYLYYWAKEQSGKKISSPQGAFDLQTLDLMLDSDGERSGAKFALLLIYNDSTISLKFPDGGQAIMFFTELKKSWNETRGRFTVDFVDDPPILVGETQDAHRRTTAALPKECGFVFDKSSGKEEILQLLEAYEDRINEDEYSEITISETDSEEMDDMYAEVIDEEVTPGGTTYGEGEETTLPSDGVTMWKSHVSMSEEDPDEDGKVVGHIKLLPSMDDLAIPDFPSSGDVVSSDGNATGGGTPKFAESEYYRERSGTGLAGKMPDPVVARLERVKSKEEIQVEIEEDMADAFADAFADFGGEYHDSEEEDADAHVLAGDLPNFDQDSDQDLWAEDRPLPSETTAQSDITKLTDFNSDGKRSSGIVDGFEAQTSDTDEEEKAVSPRIGAVVVERISSVRAVKPKMFARKSEESDSLFGGGSIVDTAEEDPLEAMMRSEQAAVEEQATKRDLFGGIDENNGDDDSPPVPGESSEPQIKQEDPKEKIEEDATHQKPPPLMISSYEDDAEQDVPRALSISPKMSSTQPVGLFASTAEITTPVIAEIEGSAASREVAPTTPRSKARKKAGKSPSSKKAKSPSSSSSSIQKPKSPGRPKSPRSPRSPSSGQRKSNPSSAGESTSVKPSEIRKRKQTQKEDAPPDVVTTFTRSQSKAAMSPRSGPKSPTGAGRSGKRRGRGKVDLFGESDKTEDTSTSFQVASPKKKKGLRSPRKKKGAKKSGFDALGSEAAALSLDEAASKGSSGGGTSETTVALAEPSSPKSPRKRPKARNPGSPSIKVTSVSEENKDEVGELERPPSRGLGSPRTKSTRSSTIEAPTTSLFRRLSRSRTSTSEAPPKRGHHKKKSTLVIDPITGKKSRRVKRKVKVLKPVGSRTSQKLKTVQIKGSETYSGTSSAKSKTGDVMKVSIKGASKESRQKATPLQYRIVRYFDLSPDQVKKITAPGILDFLAQDLAKFGQISYNGESEANCVKVSIKSSIALPRRTGAWRNVKYTLLARLGGEMIDKPDV